MDSPYPLYKEQVLSKGIPGICIFPSDRMLANDEKNIPILNNVHYLAYTTETQSIIKIRAIPKQPLII